MKAPLVEGDWVYYEYPMGFDKSGAPWRYHVFKIEGFREGGSLVLSPVYAHPAAIRWATTRDFYFWPRDVRRVRQATAIKRGWVKVI
jgi:hypothetical protein